MDDITTLLYGLAFDEIENLDKFKDWSDIKVREDLKEEEVSCYYFSFYNRINKSYPDCFDTDIWFEAFCEGFDEVNNYIYKYGTGEERKEEDECLREALYD